MNKLSSRAPKKIHVIVTQDDIDNGAPWRYSVYDCPIGRAWRRAVDELPVNIRWPKILGVSVGINRATLNDGEHLVYYRLSPRAVKFVHNFINGHAAKLKPLEFSVEQFGYCDCVYGS